MVQGKNEKKNDRVMERKKKEEKEGMEGEKKRKLIE